MRSVSVAKRHIGSFLSRRHFDVVRPGTRFMRKMKSWVVRILFTFVRAHSLRETNRGAAHWSVFGRAIRLANLTRSADGSGTGRGNTAPVATRALVTRAKF